MRTVGARGRRPSSYTQTTEEVLAVSAQVGGDAPGRGVRSRLGRTTAVGSGGMHHG